MKKLFLSVALVCMGALSSAQTKYETVMKSNIAKLEKSQSADEFQQLKDTFHRISEKEKTWRSYYYAGLAAVQKGRVLMRQRKMNELDEYGDLGIKYATKADELEPNNPEIQLIFKIANSLKMMVDPQSRYMEYGMKASEYLAKAEKLNPENPRVTLIKAEDTYFTPAAFGGSKEKGMELFKKAAEQFKTFKPAHQLDPNWGAEEANYFISKK